MFCVCYSYLDGGIVRIIIIDKIIKPIKGRTTPIPVYKQKHPKRATGK